MHDSLHILCAHFGALFRIAMYMDDVSVIVIWSIAVELHTYQLRAYLYQARDMYASDEDLYAIVSFNHYSIRSHVVKVSTCPMWDQTMVFNQVRVFGDTQSILDSPPLVVLEFFGKDQRTHVSLRYRLTDGLVAVEGRFCFDHFQGEDEFLGSSAMTPTVRLTLDVPAPRLDWIEIVHYDGVAGEMLAAVELLLDEGGELPFSPPKAPHPLTHYIVPSDIRPVLQKTRIEVRKLMAIHYLLNEW